MINYTSTGTKDPLAVGRGDHYLDIKGTFGGTSITLEWSADGVTWRLVDDRDISFAVTGAFSGVVTLPKGFVRLILTGGTPDVTVVFMPA